MHDDKRNGNDKNEGLTALREALDELGGRIKARRAPDRHLVRALLLGLGALEMDQAGSAEALAQELCNLVQPIRESWTEVLAAEMALAAAEHIRGVDPRFLDEEFYDFAYTVAARERLEARLVACSLVGYDPPERLLEEIASKDALLAPYLEER